mmetsp:Transcript_8242/g.12487  ORF Transcript_8242/g.12487 Transcript_8242/m.12487 type:complete len:215 (+) Transcript_8242:1029-1673(+)
MRSNTLGSPLGNKLCWKRSFPHTSTVSLDRPINPRHLFRTNSKPRQYGSNRRIARSNIWISPEINIEHGSIGPLNQNLLSIMVRIIRILDRIHGHDIHPLLDGFIILQLFLHINFQPRVRPDGGSTKSPKPRFKVFPILKIPNANPISRNLAGIRWSNPLFGGTNLVSPKFRLCDSIHLLMKVKDHVCPIRYQYPSCMINIHVTEVIQFIEKGW